MQFLNLQVCRSLAKKLNLCLQLVFLLMHVDDERKAFVRRDSTGREFVSLTVDGEHSFRKDLNGLFDLFYKDGLTDVKISGTLRAHLSKGGSGAIF